MKDILYIHENEMYVDFELYDTNDLYGIFIEVHYNIEKQVDNEEFHGMHTFVRYDLDVTKVIMWNRSEDGSATKVELPKSTYSFFENFINENNASYRLW